MAMAIFKLTYSIHHNVVVVVIMVMIVLLRLTLVLTFLFRLLLTFRITLCQSSQITELANETNTLSNNHYVGIYISFALIINYSDDSLRSFYHVDDNERPYD